jgi:hypothetical protein
MQGRTMVEISVEPMLFGASSGFAAEHGGPLTREFLSKLPPGGGWLIDSRVHMLKPGWYPAIPGWHLDAIPRSETHRQPDFTQDTSRLECWFAIVGDVPVCETEFLTSPVELDLRDGKSWSEFSAEINGALLYGATGSVRVPNRSVVQFGPEDFHRATPADRDGWRFFIRAMRGHNTPCANQIRRQTQVYLRDLEAGW